MADETDSTGERRTLLSQPRVISVFGVSTEYPHTACVAPRLAWIASGDQKVHLVDTKGNKKDTVCVNFQYNDLITNHQGELLFPDKTNRCVKSISTCKKKTNFPKTILRTEREPTAICRLKDRGYLVSYQQLRRIVLYTHSNKGWLSTELDHTLFTSGPCAVTENKLNQDVYIIEKEGMHVQCRGKVIALDDEFNFRYEYSSGKYFAPFDICSDILGHVLITDVKGQCVHILDKNGQFLQFLVTKDERTLIVTPTTIDVDDNGLAWIGSSRKMTVVKYFS